MPDSGRLTSVDAARGIAIMMMVAYHIFFDLYYFGIADFGIHQLPLTLLQYATGTLFVLIAGVSLTLSEQRNREGYVHHFKRGLLLAAIALAITVATWIYPHEGFIQFGIIHMIAVSTLIAPFFFRFGRMNLVLGAIIVLAGIYISTNSIMADTHWFFWLGILDPSYQALDHYAMIPWFGIVLIGIWLGQTLFPDGAKAKRGLVPAHGNAQLAFLGRNSLTIYLAHQPVIIAIIMALRMIGIV
jgi:uncharacterized membrane protein